MPSSKTRWVGLLQPKYFLIGSNTNTYLIIGCLFQIRISSKICFKKPALSSILNSLQLSQLHAGHPDSSVYYPDAQIHSATSSSPSDMTDHNRNKVGTNKNWLTYNHTRNIQHTPQSMRERNHTVSSYYNQTAIDDKARQNSIRLTPATIMYTGMYFWLYL